MSQPERNKRPRIEETSPPHHKDPTAPIPSGGSGTPTSLKAIPHPHDTPPFPVIDQEMGEQTGNGVSSPSWSDDPLPQAHDLNSNRTHTQADLLGSLHRTLESAVKTLNQLSIHATFPDHTINLIHDLYSRTAKAKSPDEQEPSDNILSAIRKLAKDVEELKCAPLNPPPHPHPTRPRDVFASGPTIRPKPKSLRPTQPPSPPNNPWQRHHPARLVLQIPPTAEPND